VSKNNARLSNWVRLYFLKVLEVSVRISCFLLNRRLPERNVTLLPRRAILVDNGERISSYSAAEWDI
jgi:hypothetical protein